jgi:hypothetical protein
VKIREIICDAASRSWLKNSAKHLCAYVFKKIIETHRDIGHIRIPNNSITTIQIIFDAT